MAPERMTLTAYAERVGVSKVAVSRAVRSGRLKNSVVRDEKGRPWIVDPVEADREWAEVDRSRAPGYVIERADPPAQPAPSQPTAEAAAEDFSRGGRPPGTGQGSALSEASAREKHWRAETAQLKFRERAGELVEAAAMAKEVAATFAACRSKILSLPSRMKQNIPDLTFDAIDVMDRICREICEELATPERLKQAAPTVQ